MNDSPYTLASLATSIALNLARAILYPFSVLFRVTSLWAIFVRTLIAVWIPVGICLFASLLISQVLLCDMHHAIKAVLAGTGVISLLMVVVAKRSWESLQIIVEEFSILHMLPLPSWTIKTAIEDTLHNFKNMSEVAKECRNQSWIFGAVAFLVVTSIAVGYSEADGAVCKEVVTGILEALGGE